MMYFFFTVPFSQKKTPIYIPCNIFFLWFVYQGKGVQMKSNTQKSGWEWGLDNLLLALKKRENHIDEFLSSLYDGLCGSICICWKHKFTFNYFPHKPKKCHTKKAMNIHAIFLNMLMVFSILGSEKL